MWPTGDLILPTAPTYLVDGDDITQTDTQVLADNLVHTDLVFIDCVVGQDDADGVFALLALQGRGTEAIGKVGSI
jgi:hypothetical protein